jgi:hypothetical protein
MSRHPLYNTWCQMIARCYVPTHQSYRNYGARGITVCERWHDVALFIEDIERTIGPRPPGMTLDRKDNDGPYVWWNVQWATRLQQAMTRRPPVKRGSDYKNLLYRIWIRMRQRHLDAICEQWTQFPVFAADIERLLGLQPAGTVFRRINPDGRYEPDNVHWGATGRPRRNA